jgi:hypothetical protein
MIREKDNIRAVLADSNSPHWTNLENLSKSASRPRKSMLTNNETSKVSTFTLLLTPDDLTHAA